MDDGAIIVFARFDVVAEPSCGLWRVEWWCSVEPCVLVAADVCAGWCDDEADAGAYVDAGVFATADAWPVGAFVVAKYEVPAFARFADWRVFHRFDGFVVGDAFEVVAGLLRVDVDDEPSGRPADDADVGVWQFFPLLCGGFGVGDGVGRAVFADRVLARLGARPVAA